jgi:large subunit ribosomal protein L15
MKLNNLVKTNSKKIRPGRGIGSGKGKTGGRGIKGQKSRSGVAIKAFEGGQTPLYRRLPKRGFKSFAPDNIAIINLAHLQKFHDNKKIDLNLPIDLKLLQNKKIINKKYIKLKILGDGELKNKTNITAHFASKQALSKIEKSGGTVNLLKKFIKKMKEKTVKDGSTLEVLKKNKS